MAERAKAPVEQLFPPRRLHLIGGPSGSGKTTWLLQTLQHWMKGESVFGYKSNPVPFAWISYDRGLEEFQETCDRVKVDWESYNFEAPRGSARKLALAAYIKQHKLKHPSVQLYIIEAIATKTPNGKMNDYGVVFDFVSELRELCEDMDITIVGTVHSPKQKEGDRYDDPRARIAGSNAWGAGTSTIIVVEKEDAESDNDARKLAILPRNSRERFLRFDMKDGLLVERPAPKSAQQKFDEYLAGLPAEANIHFTDIANKTGLGKATLTNLLARALQQKKLIQPVERGPYRKVQRDED